MITNSISASDVPTADLKLLQLALRKRICVDSRMLLEVSVELIRRDPSVVIMSTDSGKIPPHDSIAE